VTLCSGVTGFSFQAKSLVQAYVQISTEDGSDCKLPQKHKPQMPATNKLIYTTTITHRVTT